MINSIILFFAIPYVFWGLVIALSAWSYGLCHDEDDFHFGAAFLSLLIVAGLCWQFPIVFTTLTSWPEVIYVAVAYFGAGIVVAGYKWYGVLVDFKEKAPQWMETVKVANGNKADRLSSLVYGGYGKVSESKVADETIFFPNWRAFPLSNWITFWPLFTLSIVFETLGRFAKRVVKSLGAALEGVAKRFSVS